MSSWIQVHVGGISPSADVDSLEETLAEILDMELTTWAGPGTTVLKQPLGQTKESYAFLACYSTEGALLAVEQINASSGGMHAELSKPKKRPKKDSKPSADDKQLRLRRQRAPPPPKHPVQNSSVVAKNNH